MNDQSRSPRFVAFARCAGEGFHGSVAEQLVQIRKFASRSTTRLDIVDTVEVNASAGQARKALCQLIERKSQENDFDGIICTSRDRLTRNTAQYQLLELEMADIRVLTTEEHSSDDNDLLALLRRTANTNGSAVKGENISKIHRKNLAEGRASYASAVPYGVDRLYFGPNGEQLHIIRCRADGTQIQLHAVTREPMRTFSKRGYRLQEGERIDLIPGDPESVATVRFIFHARYRNDMLPGRIATELNRRSTPSARGREWSDSGIRQLLWNTIYRGTGICCRIWRKGVVKSFLPESEWIRAEYPQLRSAFIDEDILCRVEADQLAELKHKASLAEGGAL